MKILVDDCIGRKFTRELNQIWGTDVAVYFRDLVEDELKSPYKHPNIIQKQWERYVTSDGHLLELAKESDAIVITGDEDFIKKPELSYGRTIYSKIPFNHQKIIEEIKKRFGQELNGEKNNGHQNGKKEQPAYHSSYS